MLRFVVEYQQKTQRCALWRYPTRLRYLPSCLDCLPVAVGLREWLPCGLSARCGSRCAQAER